MNTVAEAVGRKLELFLMWFFALTESELRLLPTRYERWLAEHGFHRSVCGRRQVDYSAFGAWVRSGILWLVALALSVEFYAIVLGHASPQYLVYTLVTGVLIFGIAWFAWLVLYLGRLSGKLCMLIATASVFVGAILLVPPVIQYNHAGSLAFISPSNINTLIAEFIPRYWAVLGFVLVSLVMVPLLWTARLGPALISLATQNTKEVVAQTFRWMTRAFGNDAAASEAATTGLKKRADYPTSILLTAWASLALFTVMLLFSPTVWGLFGGLVIGAGAIVMFWLRATLGFIGNFVTKAIYGLATGMLVSFCSLYGLVLIVLMLVTAWDTNKGLFALALACIAIGVASAVTTMFDSTTIAEQNELSSGRPHVQPYKLKVTAIGADGKPTYEVVHPTAFNVSFTWLQLPIVWVAVAVAVCIFLGIANPLPSILALDFEHLMIYGMLLGLALMFFPKLFGKKSAPTATSSTSSHGGGH